MVFSPTDNLKRQPVFFVVCGIINLLEVCLNGNSDIRRGFSSLGSEELLNEAALKRSCTLLLSLLGKEETGKFVARTGYVLASVPSLSQTFLLCSHPSCTVTRQGQVVCCCVSVPN